MSKCSVYEMQMGRLYEYELLEISIAYQRKNPRYHVWRERHKSACLQFAPLNLYSACVYDGEWRTIVPLQCRFDRGGSGGARFPTTFRWCLLFKWVGCCNENQVLILMEVCCGHMKGWKCWNTTTVDFKVQTPSFFGFLIHHTFQFLYYITNSDWLKWVRPGGPGSSTQVSWIKNGTYPNPEVQTRAAFQGPQPIYILTTAFEQVKQLTSTRAPLHQPPYSI